MHATKKQYQLFNIQDLEVFMFLNNKDNLQ
jgi:hypothetical protein